MSTAKPRRSAAKGPAAIDIHAHYTGLKGLTRSDQARILGGNAAKLLGIN